MRAAWGAVGFAMVVAIGSANDAAPVDEQWRETDWQGERAYVAGSGGYEAIVSVNRARLIHFGRAGGGENLLYVPPDLSNRAEWGGHRVWLGPQTEWSRNWPPPVAWEASAAESVDRDGARLELLMPTTGDEWPRLRRVYEWKDGRLHCEARIEGGRRAAQIIHVLQVLPTAEIQVKVAPTAEVPRGYVQLHLGRGVQPLKTFSAPPHVEGQGDLVTLRFAGKMEKLGFPQQPLLARVGGATFRVAPGISSGRVESTPDEGFVTQVYFSGSRAPLIELEQLSPQYARDQEARFEIVIDPSALPDAG